MKYGRIVYDNRERGETKYTNVGDWFQTFAIDDFYQSLGVKPEKIVEIHRNQLKTYKGEKIIVILQGWFNQLTREDFFPVSKDIIPIYFGLHRTEKKNILISEDEYIGCRDEETYNILAQKSSKAYIFGCLTMTLPKREMCLEQTELFLVDVPASLYKFIPEKYKGKTHVVTQEIETCKNPEKESLKLLELYKNKAALVVTSRLHCAAPCLGMGIPVILVREYFDDRYGWIDKYLTLYTPETFSSIKWEVVSPDIDNIKEMMYDALRYKIEGNNNLCEEKMKSLHEIYSSREKRVFKAPFKAKSYWFMSKIMPNFSNFIRWKVLKRFTIIGKNSNEKNLSD